MSGALLARLGVVERAQDISRGLLGSAWASSVSGYKDECRSRQGRVFQGAGYGRAASDATHDCCGAAGCTRPAQLAQSTLEEDNHRAGPPSKMLGVVIADKKKSVVMPSVQFSGAEYLLLRRAQSESKTSRDLAGATL